MIALIIYIAVCIFLAWDNAQLIKKGRRIYHALNGLIHLTGWALIVSFQGWEYLFILPFVARLAFDMSLALFRGLDPGYVADKPKSIADKLEKFIFGEDGITPKLLWFFFIVVGVVIISHL
jgi:hypothetical protein